MFTAEQIKAAHSKVKSGADFPAAKYDVSKIAETSQADQFKLDLIAHQQGKTDFLTFCNDCAKSGVEKWAVI